MTRLIEKQLTRPTRRPCGACLGVRENTLVDGWVWGKLKPEVNAVLAASMALWLHTPYAAGQRVRGHGVDCVRLVAGILDPLYQTATELPRTAQDAGVHSTRGAGVLVKAMRSAWPCYRVRPNTTDAVIYPGDVILCAIDEGGRVNHAMVATPQPWQALHATKAAGVCVTSVMSTRLVAVYRTTQKGRWIKK